MTFPMTCQYRAGKENIRMSSPSVERGITFILMLMIPHLLFCQTFHWSRYSSQSVLPGDLFFDNKYYGETILDSALFKVLYDKTFEVDTVNHECFHSEETLLIGRRWTKFQEVHREAYEQSAGKDFETSYNTYWRSICTLGHYLFYADTYFIDNQARKCIFTFKLGADDYKMEEDVPDFQWTIRDTTKTIGEYECTLAKGRFGGREWEAWFTMDIPCSGGPWKLNGLPGLILEAADSKGQYRFVFSGIQTEEEPVTMATYPYVSINRRRYNREARCAVEDYISYINMHISRVSRLRSIEWKAENTRKYNVPMKFDLIEITR